MDGEGWIEIWSNRLWTPDTTALRGKIGGVGLSDLCSNEITFGMLCAIHKLVLVTSTPVHNQMKVLYISLLSYCLISN